MRNKEIQVTELGRVKGHRAYVTNHEVILELEPSQCKSLAEEIQKSASGTGITRIVAKWGRRGADGFDVLVLSTGRTNDSSHEDMKGMEHAEAKVPHYGASAVMAAAPVAQLASEQPAASLMLPSAEGGLSQPQAS